MTELGNSPRALGLAEVLNAEGVKADRQEHFQRALDEGGEDLRTVVEHLVAGRWRASRSVTTVSSPRSARWPTTSRAARPGRQRVELLPPRTRVRHAS